MRALRPLRAVLVAAFAAVGAAGWLAAFPAQAGEVTSEAPEAVSVTIYQDQDARVPHPDPGQSLSLDQAGGSLSLIVETRTVDLPAGESVVRFRRVAEGLIAETAEIEGAPGAILQRNFDYDLISPGALAARAVGGPVTLVRTDPRTGRAVEQRGTLRSGPNGLVVDLGDGRIEAVGCDDQPQRLVFDRIPPGLADQPTLSIRVVAPRAGRYVLKLHYLTTGLTWTADYVARFSPDASSFSLEGWITLTNYGATGFKDAPIQVVAGRVNLTENYTPDEPVVARRTSACWQRRPTFASPRPRLSLDPVWYSPAPPELDGTEVDAVVVTGSRIRRNEFTTSSPIAVVTEEALGDYRLYSLPGPTQLPSRQTKQVRFLVQPAARLDRVYVAEVYAYAPDKEEVIAPVLALRGDNRPAQGLGRSLPGGSVSFLASGAGGGPPVVLGMAGIADAPVGLPLDWRLWTVGNVLVVSRTGPETVEPLKKGRLSRQPVEVEVANGQAEPIVLEVVPELGGDGRIEAETVRHGDRNGAPAWTFRLKPGERRVLRYVFVREYGA